MRAGRERRPRSVTTSLAQIVLAFEFVVVALAALVVFGLGDLPPQTALGGGGILLAVILAAIALARSRAGIALGWVVQVLFVLSGLRNVAVGLVGLIFAVLWVYSMSQGRKIDRRASSS